jgi:signal transduction histidine kinase/DNA-binding NarL/FixJ family response regulator
MSNHSYMPNYLMDLNLLNAVPESDFDEIVEIASELAKTPISILTFLEGDKLWFKSKIGVSEDYTDKANTFFSHTIDCNDTLIVEDASKDARFKNTPLVYTPANIRFYAGVPITAGNDEAVGSLCVIDRKPRTFSESQKSALIRLRNQIERLILLRKKINDHEHTISALTKEVEYRSKLELAFIEENKRSEVNARTKELFLANMSHEIRTPLNAIIGFAHQMGKTDLLPQQRMYMDTIHSAAKNLMSIINDILDMSKIDAGKISIEKIPFNFKEVIKDVLSLTSDKASEKGLRLNLSLDINISDHLLGDPQRFRQILINLINNAIKFTSKGVIKVKTLLLEERENMQVVSIAVSDTGMGMDESFLKRIFENFSQAESSTCRQFGGTGLGLSITKQLLELMGGEIAVESEKGKGSTFTIKVPFTKSENNTSHVTAKNGYDINVIHHRKILIIEDNVLNRMLIAAILNPFEVALKEVENGEEAINLLRTGELFDLILLDLQMPKLDGFQTLEYIRETLHINTPVMAITANALKGEAEKCMEKGFDGYLAKPFEESDLLREISTLISGTKLKTTTDPAKHQENRSYDLSKLRSIAKGNEAFVKNMIKLFCIEIPEALISIEDGLITDDVDKIKRTAHKIKPALETMGISTLHGPISALEKMSMIDKDTNELVKKVKRVCDTVIEDFEKSI